MDGAEARENQRTIMVVVGRLRNLQKSRVHSLSERKEGKSYKYGPQMEKPRGWE